MRIHLVPASIVLALCSVVACGGDLADEVQPAGQAPEGNRDGHDNVPPPGSGPKCETGSIPLTHACIRPLRAEVPLELYAEDDSCNSGGCEGMTRSVSCAVAVEGETIFLDLVVQTCTDGREGPMTCTSDCRSLGVTCKLPPLAAGTYRVVGRDAPWVGGKKLERSLVVRDEGAQESCLDTSDAALGK